ncbi:MAG TPA: NADP-dependent phosphogluconate dehydrogenase [Myxococcota bacterium]|nr:NADP-dependent phosphogluconate dehydrogenase [Myxococcota bacterium]
MKNNKKREQCQVGIIGLGTMGHNLALNMSDHGFVVAGYDRHEDKVQSLIKESQKPSIYGATGIEELLALLKKPRAIILLVAAGKPVDLVINELLPHLEPDDLVVDAGNSHFIDTDIRERRLQEKNIQFLGVGISGGKEGARHGASIMPGGSKISYERIRPILEAVAAKVNGDPCVAYLGTGSAGHYVKMVHNGIEYGIMQLIAETYDFMKRGLNLSNEKIRDVYLSWNQSELKSYLIEITGHIFGKVDSETGRLLVDEISDSAKQTGTGMWTSQNAMDLNVPIPTIDAAVAMRNLSGLVEERKQANLSYERLKKFPADNQQDRLRQLQGALYVGIIITYAQGMALLRSASKKYDYKLDLEVIARIWRGGCIIRAELLEDICTAFRLNSDLPNLLFDQNMARKITKHQEDLRQILSCACVLGVPTPALMAALSYFDAYRSERLPANLVQAQRDYFGAHTYERIDVKGTFHTEWEDT